MLAAKHEAEQLPIHAERRSRRGQSSPAPAKEEAGRSWSKLGPGEAARSLSKTKVRMGEAEKLADVNLEKAVKYVLERVTGRV
jgi:hypothetical protein